MASAYLTRTPSSTGSQTKFTFSCWVKKCATGTNGVLYSCGNATNTNYYTSAVFNSDDLLRLNWYNDSGNQQIRTNRTFRDTSGFYHIVIAWDTTQSTASDRVKIYVNGVQETSFASAAYPNQNQAMLFNTASHKTEIGRAVDNSNFFNGLMTHVHVADGTAYAASTFGESDSNGVWIPKPSPSVTYGTNGFFLKMDNSGNMGLDSSGQSNNLTTSGTLTQAKDTPSNVFAVFNTLDNYYPAMTLSNGNTKALTIAGKYTYIPTTLGMTSGKYYAEIKVTAQSGSQDAMVIGITSTSSGATTDELGHYANDYGYYGTGNLQNNDSNTSYGSSYTTGDIIGIAIDLDNNKLYFSKNSVWQNSGVPTSGSTGTGAVSITDPDSTPRGAYFFAVNNWSSTTTATFEANFGNGYFGTTAVTSAGTNASGNGIFEYDVPTGYTALSTKGLDS
jgi:hypothetical protein